MFQCSKEKFSLSIVNIETYLLELKLVLKKKIPSNFQKQVEYIILNLLLLDYWLNFIVLKTGYTRKQHWTKKKKERKKNYDIYYNCK